MSRDVGRPPAYSVDQLLQIIDPDIRKPMNMIEVILRIVDGSGLEVFKPNFGKGMITAWAHIHGKARRRFIAFMSMSLTV